MFSIKLFFSYLNYNKSDGICYIIHIYKALGKTFYNKKQRTAQNEITTVFEVLNILSINLYSWKWPNKPKYISSASNWFFFLIFVERNQVTPPFSCILNIFHTTSESSGIHRIAESVLFLTVQNIFDCIESILKPQLFQ